MIIKILDIIFRNDHNPASLLCDSFFQKRSSWTEGFEKGVNFEEFYDTKHLKKRKEEAPVCFPSNFRHRN